MRISLLLLLEQKISTGGLLLALGGGVATFSAAEGAEGIRKRGEAMRRGGRGLLRAG